MPTMKNEAFEPKVIKFFQFQSNQVEDTANLERQKSIQLIEKQIFPKSNFTIMKADMNLFQTKSKVQIERNPWDDMLSDVLKDKFKQEFFEQQNKLETETEKFTCMATNLLRYGNRLWRTFINSWLEDSSRIQHLIFEYYVQSQIVQSIKSNFLLFEKLHLCIQYTFQKQILPLYIYATKESNSKHFCST
ncbi:Conserved_hypothetical protein [Hexamita inflata]|uniref:Uncharacterized protein n=1 Tax=Hexamita inflata TaxID=28002 RepID=A0AA86TRB0_9EUKA|nr:Conserved hypothetical protein [Hexamita inflata]